MQEHRAMIRRLTLTPLCTRAAIVPIALGGIFFLTVSAESGETPDEAAVSTSGCVSQLTERHQTMDRDPANVAQCEPQASSENAPRDVAQGSVPCRVIIGGSCTTIMVPPPCNNQC